MGRKRNAGRPVNGIVVLDKPTSFGSNEVLQIAKRLFRAQKAGHTGSLDRLACGLLPLCFGEATKFSAFLLNSNKRYLATFKLGVTTNTGDAQGVITSQRSVGKLTRTTIESAISHFIGDIEQVPPMFSALKHQGKRLYQLAHQGIVVDRPPRPVKIFHYNLLEIRDDLIDVDIRCSKGTYVRTLAEDLGEALGCGASVASLRRIEAGPFGPADLITVEQLQDLHDQGGDAIDTVLLPIETAVSDWPEVRLAKGVAYYLQRGQPVLVPHSPTSGDVRLYDDTGQFLGVGEVLDDGRIAPRRLLQC